MRLDHEASVGGRLGRWWESHRLGRLAGLLLIVMAALVLFFPGLFHMRCDEVDIRSGRIRRTHYVLLIRTHRSIAASPLSQVLPTAGTAEPHWRTVNTFEGVSHVSPHHTYHSAIAQMQIVDMIWKLASFTPEAKRQTAATVLALWQSAGGDSAAQQYIHALEDVVSKAKNSRQTIGIAELPAPPISTRPTAR